MSAPSPTPGRKQNRSASLRKVAHQLLSREECETFKAALRAFRETTTAGQLISSLEKIIDSPKKLSLLREIALLLPMEQRRDFIQMSRQKFKGSELLLQEENIAQEAAIRLRKKSSSTCLLHQPGLPAIIEPPSTQLTRSLSQQSQQPLQRAGSATFSGKRMSIHQLGLAETAISKLERAVGLAEKITLADSAPIRRLKDDSAPKVIKLNSATFQVRYKSQISPFNSGSQPSILMVPAVSNPGLTVGVTQPPKFQSLGFVRQPPQISVIKEESPTDDAGGSGARNSPAKSPARTTSATTVAQDPDDELMERIKNQIAKPRAPLAALQDKGFWALNSPRRNLQEQRKQERRLLQETAQELIKVHVEAASPEDLRAQATHSNQDSPPPYQTAAQMPQPTSKESEEVHVMPCHDETNHGICDLILDRPDSEVTTGFSTDTDTEGGQPTAVAAAAAAAVAAAVAAGSLKINETPPTAGSQKVSETPLSVKSDGEATPANEIEEDVIEGVDEKLEEVRTIAEVKEPEEHDEQEELPAVAVYSIAPQSLQSTLEEPIAEEGDDLVEETAEIAEDAIEAEEATNAEAGMPTTADVEDAEGDSREVQEIVAAAVASERIDSDLISRRSVSMVEVASVAGGISGPISNGMGGTRDTLPSQERLREKSSSLQRTDRHDHGGRGEGPKYSNSPPVADNQLYRMLYGQNTTGSNREDDQASVTSSVLESDYLKARLLHGWTMTDEPTATQAASAPTSISAAPAKTPAIQVVTASCQTDAEVMKSAPATEAHDFGLQVSFYSDQEDRNGVETRKRSSVSPVADRRPSVHRSNQETQCDLTRVTLQDSTTSPAESINLSGSRRRSPMNLPLLASSHQQQSTSHLSASTPADAAAAAAAEEAAIDDALAEVDQLYDDGKPELDTTHVGMLNADANETPTSLRTSEPIAIDNGSRRGQRRRSSSSFSTSDSTAQYGSAPAASVSAAAAAAAAAAATPTFMPPRFPHPSGGPADFPSQGSPFSYFYPPPQMPPMMMHPQSQSRPMSPMSRAPQPHQQMPGYSSSYPGNLFFQWMTGQMMMQAAAAQMPYGGFSPADFFNQFYGQYQQQQQNLQSEAGSEPDIRHVTLVKAGGTFGLSITLNKRDGDLPTVLVSAVATGSPAYQQGIQPGDELVELEGERVSNMTLQQLGMAIRNQNKIRLAIRVRPKSGAVL